MSQILKQFTVTARSATAITLTPVDTSTGAGVDHPSSVVITEASLTCCDKERLLLVGQSVRMRLELYS